MFVTIAGNAVFVRLSQRNLCQLNAIIAGGDAGHRYLARKDDNGVSLVVHVEDDADHYEEREPVGVGVGDIAQQPQEANQ